MIETIPSVEPQENGAFIVRLRFSHETMRVLPVSSIFECISNGRRILGTVEDALSIAQDGECQVTLVLEPTIRIEKKLSSESEL